MEDVLAMVAADDLKRDLNLTRLDGTDTYWCFQCECVMNCSRAYVLHLVTEQHQAIARATSTRAEIDAVYWSGPHNILYARIIGCPHQALVGLEYIIEVHISDSAHGPLYVCRLCQAIFGPVSILFHVNSRYHREQFLGAHFPSVLRQVQGYLDGGDPITGVTVMQYVCERLDRKFGRMIPLSVYVTDLCRIDACYGNMRQIVHQSETDSEALTATIVRADRILGMMAGRPPIMRGYCHNFMQMFVFPDEWYGWETSPEVPDDDAPSRLDTATPLVALVEPLPGHRQAPDLIRSPHIDKLFQAVVQRCRQTLRDQHTAFRESPSSHPQYEDQLDRYMRLNRRHTYPMGLDTMDRRSIRTIRRQWPSMWREQLRRCYDRSAKLMTTVAARQLLEALEVRARKGCNGVRITHSGNVVACDIQPWREETETEEEVAAEQQTAKEQAIERLENVVPENTNPTNDGHEHPAQQLASDPDVQPDVVEDNRKIDRPDVVQDIVQDIVQPIFEPGVHNGDDFNNPPTPPQTVSLPKAIPSSYSASDAKRSRANDTPLPVPPSQNPMRAEI